MFVNKILRISSKLLLQRKATKNTSTHGFFRTLTISSPKLEENKDKEPRSIAHRESFEDIKNKNKDTYLEMVKIFVNRDHIYRRGHVEFIYSAMKNMESFGVNRDIEVYRALIDVLPKGKFIPTNMFQAEFMHYPKQQQCIIDLLEQMEDNGVIPDFDMEDLLLNIFGRKGFPLRKFWRMMYWMPKFKNLSPWPVPDPLPVETFDLAKYAIERISSVDENSTVTVYQSSDIAESIDDTWIISAQSKNQKRLLSEHKVDEPVYVEGAFKVWIKGNPINYFVLKAKPKPKKEEEVDIDDVSKLNVSPFNIKPPTGKYMIPIPSVHEQEDGVIFSVCATGMSSKDSLLSWVRHLERDGNPNLNEIPIVFTLRSSTIELTNIENDIEKLKE